MRALFAFLVPLSLFALGCGEDLGSCDDPNQGRDTVIVNGVVMYGGQAIINKSCAGGRCHSSNATGTARSGAPAGLDFDLVPIGESEADGEVKNKRGETVVALTPRQRAALRVRQRTVYDNRDRIWEQVRYGLMPPPASEFSVFRELKSIFDSEEDAPCEKDRAYSSLQSTRGQEVLRNWLACRVPIVESNGSVVEVNDEGGQTGGAIGWQFPICEVPTENPDGSVIPISLETLLTGPLSSCEGCHPVLSPPDFSTLQRTAAAFASSEEACDGKPLVTPGDPEQSFLYDLLAREEPGCGHSRMPYNSPPLTGAQLQQVQAWILSGAPTTDGEAESSSE